MPLNSACLYGLYGLSFLIFREKKMKKILQTSNHKFHLYTYIYTIAQSQNKCARSQHRDQNENTLSNNLRSHIYISIR